jgi:hypothetical protein
MIFFYFPEYANKMSTIDEVYAFINKKKDENKARAERARLAEIKRLKSLVNPFSKEETEELITQLFNMYYPSKNENEKFEKFVEWFNVNSLGMKIERSHPHNGRCSYFFTN